MFGICLRPSEQGGQTFLKSGAITTEIVLIMVDVQLPSRIPPDIQLKLPYSETLGLNIQWLMSVIIGSNGRPERFDVVGIVRAEDLDMIDSEWFRLA